MSLGILEQRGWVVAVLGGIAATEHPQGLARHPSVNKHLRLMPDGLEDHPPAGHRVDAGKDRQLRLCWLPQVSDLKASRRAEAAVLSINVDLWQKTAAACRAFAEADMAALDVRGADFVIAGWWIRIEGFCGDSISIDAGAGRPSQVQGQAEAAQGHLFQ